MSDGPEDTQEQWKRNTEVLGENEVFLFRAIEISEDEVLFSGLYFEEPDVVGGVVKARFDVVWSPAHAHLEETVSEAVEMKDAPHDDVQSKEAIYSGNRCVMLNYVHFE